MLSDCLRVLVPLAEREVTMPDLVLILEDIFILRDIFEIGAEEHLRAFSARYRHCGLGC